MKLVKACIALAAFAAIFVVPSMASAIELTAPTGKTFEGKIIATNIKTPPENKVHTLLTTPIGTVTCDKATMTGETIGKDGTHVAGEITTVQFEGPEAGKPCTSPVGNVTVTPSHASNPVHEGHSALPWCITAGKENKFSVWGKNGNEACNVANPVIKPITFTMHTALAGTCSYQRAEALTGTYTTHPSDFVATVTNAQAVFKKITGGGFCPGEGSLHMTFTLTVDNNGAHGEPLYIDP
jgi:hypothetical protein